MGQTNSTNNSVDYNTRNINISDTVTVGLLCEQNEEIDRRGNKIERFTPLEPIKKYIVDNLIKRDNINIIWETIDLENSNIVLTNANRQTVPIELHNKYDLIVGLGCPVNVFFINAWKSTYKFVYTTLKPNGILSFITRPANGDVNFAESRYKEFLSELRLSDNKFKDSFTNPKYYKHLIINDGSNFQSIIVVFKKKNIVVGGKKKKVIKKKVKKVIKK
jgi:hypothetical protein